MNQGQLEDAAASFRDILALKPDFALAHFNLAKVLLEQEKLADAVASYRQGLQVDPSNIEANYNLGSAASTGAAG